MFLKRYFLNLLFLKDIAVLVDLFKLKNVQIGDIYHCYNDITALHMQNMFNADNIRISNRRVNQNCNALKIKNYAKVGVVINASCQGWIKIMDSLGQNAFKSPFVWFVAVDNVTETTKVLSRYKIDLNSDVTVISKNEDRYNLYEVYNTGYKKNGQYVVREVGVWNESLYVEAKDRMNLKGLKLKATIVIPQSQRVVNKTFVTYLEEEPDLIKVDPMHKFKAFTALKYFRDMFNVTYEFQRSNSWGYPTNGTFDGLVGALQRLETDIGGSPLFIRADRMAALDYAAETWLTRPAFIFRHPKHPGGYFSIYTRPLTTEVWYCVILVTTISAIMLGVLINLKIIKVAGDDEDMSPSLVLLVIWSAICQQGMSISRSSNSIKMVMFMTFLFTLTIYQYYNATVVSTLLHEQPKNIKTLQDLTKSSLSAGIEDILYNSDYFQHTIDPVAREIYLKKVVHTTPHRFYSPEQGMALVKKGGFAFHVDSAVAYRIMRHTFTEKELCELQEVQVFGSYLGLAVIKQSPYREIMAYGCPAMILQRYFLNYLIIKDVAVVIDLFNHKNVKHGDIYHCNNDIIALKMYKMFNANNIRTSSRRIGQNSSVNEIKKYEKAGVLINASCFDWIDILDALDENVFKSYLVWFIMTENITETTEVLTRYKIDFNSDVTLISKNEDRYVLYEVYNTGYNRKGQYIVREVGLWNKSLHIEAKDRKNLKGLMLRSTVVIPKTQRIVKKTFVRYLEEEEPDLVKVDPVHKLKGFAVLKYFRDMFNVTYDFQRSDSWGYPTNGTFDGMVGALQRSEADIGGSPLFIRVDRMAALDYAGLMWLTRPIFIFRHPTHHGSYFFIYTRPFATEVWYCVISVMILSTIILGVLLKLTTIKSAGDDKDRSPSLALLLIWSAICQQGMITKRSSNSVKMVTFTTLVFALTMYQYYDGAVMSTLLQEQPRNIKTLQDLTKSSLGVGVENILYNVDYFRHTVNPVAREIYLKKVVHTTPHRFYSPEQGMALVKKGGFAFHVDSAVAYRIIRRTFSETELCELQEVMVFNYYTCLAVTKGSPYRDIMAYGINRLKEHGILSRLLTVWDEPRPNCVRTPDSSIISVSIKEFSTPLAVLLFGYIATMMIFIVELLASRCGRRR